VRLNREGTIEWTIAVEPKLPEQQRIREDHGYASSTPAVDDERVYVFFGKTGALAFDHTGERLWQTDVGSKLNGWGSATSPVLFGDLVIINASVESDSLVALDKKTGDEVWRAGRIREAWNTPVLVKTEDGKTELVVAVAQKILGFDPQTGKELWSCKSEINSYIAPSVVADNCIVYSVGGRTNGSLAVRAGGRGDVTDSHRLWTGKKGSNVTSPIYHDGHLYWMNDRSGIAFCADAKTGEIVYEERPRPEIGQVYASPVLVDGKIYYLGRGGTTFVVAAKPKWEVLAVNDRLERGVYNASPAVADGRLYLRTDKHLYCIGTP
jgi:outer membrane protein assembly factor BamB